MDNLDELMTAIAETEKYDNIRKQNHNRFPEETAKRAFT